MKSLAFLTVIFIHVGLSVQIPKLVNCPDDFVLSISMANECGTVTCDGSDAIFSANCDTWECDSNIYLGYKESDNSKTYPDCCGGPICADVCDTSI